MNLHEAIEKNRKREELRKKRLHNQYERIVKKICKEWGITREEYKGLAFSTK